MRKIYLAGPDVFFSDPDERFDHLERLCDAQGAKGIRPSDGGPHDVLDPLQRAQRIYQSNVDRIRACDALIANMVPFRGRIEPDSGTVFEVGMAVALGKPVGLYIPQGLADLRSRVASEWGLSPDHDGLDVNGVRIENFGLPLNLMLSIPAESFDHAQEAIAHVLSRLNQQADRLPFESAT